MARPNTITFGKFLVLVGDGASPEVFAAPCGFTDRSLDMNSETNSTDVPDCDNPDAPVWSEKSIKTLSATVTGQGVLAQEAHATWREWFFSGAPRNVRVKIDLTGAQGGGYYEGSAILTQFKVDSSYGDKVKVSVTLNNNSEWTWTDAA